MVDDDCDMLLYTCAVAATLRAAVISLQLCVPFAPSTFHRRRLIHRVAIFATMGGHQPDALLALLICAAMSCALSHQLCGHCGSADRLNFAVCMLLRRLRSLTGGNADECDVPCL